MGNKNKREREAAGKQYILIADDEEEIRFSLQLQLSREGYQVSTVEDGESALKALDEQEYDLLICDLIMPGLSGLELLDALKERPHPQIILMSAHADAQTAWKAIERGAADYLAKPYRASEVLFRVRKALEQNLLKNRLGRLEEVLGEQQNFGGIIAQSKAMARIFYMIRKVADYHTTVLLTGESGTGKELVARALHFESQRRRAAFVAVNCGAIPGNLLESELFGHVRGAFTDATRTRRGLFEEAHEGTLFLDEVGELPLSLQVKLLRVLQEEEIRRVGDSRALKVNVRVVAATVKDLNKEIEKGSFREDLFYRLNVLTIALPALRERRADIPLLIQYFQEQLNERLGLSIQGLSPEAMKLMKSYSWPGNVRELQNAMERAMVLSETEQLLPEDLPPKIRQSQDPIRQSLSSGELSIKKTAKLIEAELIRRALEKTGGNRTRAAEHLEISHRALLYKIKKYGLSS